MSNNLRTRNGLPFNFVDGLAIGGVPLESIVAGSASGVSFATNAETQAGTVTDKVISPSNLASVTSGLSPISHTHSQYAPLASPSLTGVPLAPTATVGTNTTQIATTAFVQATTTAAANPTPDASTTVAGKIMIASAGDITSTNKAVTPAMLEASVANKINKGTTYVNVTGHQQNGVINLTNEDVSESIIEIYGVLTSGIVITIPGSTPKVTLVVHRATSSGVVGSYTHPVILRCRLDSGVDSLSSVELNIDERKFVHTTYSDIFEDGGNFHGVELTGIPTAPTATAGTSTTQVATTGFVQNAVGAVTIPDASTTVAGKVELATVTETITGTDFNKAVTPAAVQSHMLANSLGWNQQWSDFTGSRTIDILYQNTTGKPIQIAVTFGGPDGHVWIGPTAGSLMEITGTTTSGTGSGSRPVHSLIIPNLQYYKATNSGIDKWFELR